MTDLSTKTVPELEALREEVAAQIRPLAHALNNRGIVEARKLFNKINSEITKRGKRNDKQA